MTSALLPQPAAGGHRYRVYIDDRLLDAANFAAALQAAGDPKSVNRYIIGLRESGNRDRVLEFAGKTGAIVITNLQAHFAEHPTVVAFDALEPERHLETYGLALSDALVVNDPTEASEPVAEARLLGKPLLTSSETGKRIKPLIKAGSAQASDAIGELRRLQPRLRSNAWERWLATRFGQTDGFITELLVALAELVRLLGALSTVWRTGQTGAAKTHFIGFVRRLLKAVFLPWRPVDLKPYFAPKDWETQCPSELFGASPLIERFNWLDVSALAGARTYRAILWWLYTFASAAVAAAVLGYISGDPALPFLPHVSRFAVIELALLGAIVSIVIWLNGSGFQHRWTAARIGAEQLRIAAMALPVHVVPPMLVTRDNIDGVAPAKGGPHAHKDKDLSAAAVLAYVKRVVREHDPIRMRADATVSAGARWVKHIVDDQQAYHSRNHEHLEAVELGVQACNALLFGGVIVMVGMHLAHPFWPAVPEISWSLLVTAYFPAVIATFHGASGRLEISHRSELSRANGEELARVSEELEKLIGQPGSTDWNRLRDLTRRAIRAMGSEADAWYSTMLLEPVSLP